MGWVEKQYGVRFGMNSRAVSFLRGRDLPALRVALKPLVEKRLGVPIRRVVTYEETIVNGGFCETCSYEEVAVRVVFKSSEGKLCVYDISGSLVNLMGELTAGD